MKHEPCQEKKIQQVECPSWSEAALHGGKEGETIQQLFETILTPLDRQKI